MNKFNFKNVWRIWDSLDRIVFIFAIIGLMCIGMITCNSCHAQDVANLEEMDYGQFRDIYVDDIYASNVLDFIFNPVDENYVIEYVDHGIQPEEITDEHDTIYIVCTKDVFFAYMDWYDANYQEDYPCPTYGIEVTEDEGYYSFRLIER